VVVFDRAARTRRTQVAVLAGHVHSAQAQPVGGVTDAMQYVTAASCEGGQRDILFTPLALPRL
jgi:hypothetical protein